MKALDNPDAPIKSLKGFQRVKIAAGQTVSVKIDLDPAAFDFYDEAVDGLSTKTGNYQVLYGPSSDDAVLQVLPIVVS